MWKMLSSRCWLKYTGSLVRRLWMFRKIMQQLPHKVKQSTWKMMSRQLRKLVAVAHHKQQVKSLRIRISVQMQDYYVHWKNFDRFLESLIVEFEQVLIWFDFKRLQSWTHLVTSFRRREECCSQWWVIWIVYLILAVFSETSSVPVLSLF